MNLTYKNKHVLELIVDLCEKHCAPPTIVQISQAMGVKSHNAAVNHIKRLVEAGVIERLDDNSSRRYMPVEWRNRVQAALQICAGVSTAELMEKRNTKLRELI